MQLGERKLKVLAALIENYVATGEPVGSKAVMAALSNCVSSATIRNDMSDLSDYGYLTQPHTSAGRIPTQKGYRLYVDRLMHKRPLSSDERRFIDSRLFDFSVDPEKFLEDTSALLAEITKYAAVTTTPSDETLHVSKIELIPTGGCNVLLLVIISSGVFKHRLCRLDIEPSTQVLDVLKKIINRHFSGKQLKQLHYAMIQNISLDLGETGFIILPLLGAALDAAREALESDIMLEGQANLLSYGEYTTQYAHSLMQFLSRKPELSAVLARDKQGVSVSIGRENSKPELEYSSMVTAHYSTGGAVGTIGIIGPLRMDYGRIIPHIEYFAASVGRLLRQTLDETDSGDQQ